MKTSGKIIAAIRARKERQGRKGLRLRPPRMLPPKNAEKAYVRLLLVMVDRINGLVDKMFVSQIPDILREAEQTRPDGFRADWAVRIKEILESIRIGSTQFFPEEDVLMEIAQQINNHDLREIRRAVRLVLGVDVLVSEPWLADYMKSFAAENVALITSIRDQSLDWIEGAVQRGIRAGKRHEELSREIRERYEVTKSSARLIARDQTAKFNGQITRAMQKQIGIDEYIWQSSGDERTRKSHSVMDGKVCRWDDPTIYREQGSDEWLSRSSIGGVNQHPGQDVQCRCTGLPNLDPLLKEAGI